MTDNDGTTSRRRRLADIWKDVQKEKDKFGKYVDANPVLPEAELDAASEAAFAAADPAPAKPKKLPKQKLTAEQKRLNAKNAALKRAANRANRPQHAKGGAKRHRKVLRDNIQGITKAAVKRLARRGGVKRMSGKDNLILEKIREILKEEMKKAIGQADTFREYHRKKTIMLEHMNAGLRTGELIGCVLRPVYGY